MRFLTGSGTTSQPWTRDCPRGRRASDPRVRRVRTVKPPQGNAPHDAALRGRSCGGRPRQDTRRHAGRHRPFGCWWFSLYVVILTKYPAGDNARLWTAIAIAFGAVDPRRLHQRGADWPDRAQPDRCDARDERHALRRRLLVLRRHPDHHDRATLQFRRELWLGVPIRGVHRGSARPSQSPLPRLARRAVVVRGMPPVYRNTAPYSNAFVPSVATIGLRRRAADQEPVQ